MSRSRAGVIFDAVWLAWSRLCGGLAILAVCLLVVFWIRQTHKDREFVRTELMPSARYVESFRDAQGRLPTDAEFKKWTGTKNPTNPSAEYYWQKPNFISDWGTPGHDFVVGAWRGEWMHYYRSWDGKDFAGELAPLREPASPRR